MRITILLFLTISSFLISCDGDKTYVKKFDLDSRDYMFFNEGSYWIYERHDEEIDTIQLVKVEISEVLDYKGDQMTERRVDTYWSTAEKQLFKRTSKDTVIKVFDKVLGKKVEREIFRYSSKFHTYYSDYYKSDEYVDQVCFVIDDTDSTYFGNIYKTKTLVADFPYKEDVAVDPDSTRISVTYAKGLGMTWYKNVTDSTEYALKLIGSNIK